MNKKYDEIALDLVCAWLDHESKVSTHIGRTTQVGEPKSVQEIAQAYLDFSFTIVNGTLPTSLNKPDSSDDDA